MEKLLLPVDGSPSAVRAAQFLVRSVSGRPLWEVHLIHVLQPILTGEISVHLTAEMAKQWHEQAGRTDGRRMA